MDNDKKVKLDILIKLAKTNNFDVGKYIMRRYIPYREKIDHINKFVSDVLDEHGNYDSMDKYFKFTMMVFNIYTNLELDNTYEEYDKLVNSGLLDLVFSEIEEDYYDLKDDKYYYLTEESTTSSGYKFKYVSGDDLHEIYNHLSKPYRYIES